MCCIAIKVPELWIYDSGKLKINRLQGDRYTEAETSPTFPELPIPKIVSQTVERAKQIGMSQALQEFEDWLHQQEVKTP